MSKKVYMDCLWKFPNRESCAMGEMKWDFFTGMHISRTKLYSDSVHLFLCNKYVCFLDRVLCGYVIHVWHRCCPFPVPRPPPPRKVRCGSGRVGCQSKHHWCIFPALIQSVIRGRGVARPQSPLHTIGQGTKTSLSCGSLKHSMVIISFCI